MTSREIKSDIINAMTNAVAPFDRVEPEMCAAFWKNHAENPEAYRFPPNWSYIDCSKGTDLLSFCLTHPEFSHFSHRNRYSVSIYWHCEGSPSGVELVGGFDPDRMQEAYKILGDEIGAAQAWAAGYN